MHHNQTRSHLTIHIYADDRLRSTNQNNNDRSLTLESSPVQLLFPRPIDDVQRSPSVPPCYKQDAHECRDAAGEVALE